MKKLLLLTRILRKVGSGQDNENEKKYAGDTRQLITVFLSIALAIGLFFASGWIADYAGLFGGTGAIFSCLFLIVGIMVFFLSILDLIGTLYMSTDLPVLLSLPFSANQIVLARIINACRTTVIFASLIILPFGVGFGTKVSVSPMYWVGLILGNLCVPVSAVALAAIVIIVIMAVFPFFRRRDTVTIIGALLAFALAILLSVGINVENKVDGEQVRQTVGGVIGIFSSVSVILPSVPLICDLMDGGSPLLILPVLCITAGLIPVFLLISRFLYLRGALAMQDTAAASRKLEKEALFRVSEKRSVREACIRRDLRTIFRTPAYLTNGWLMAFLWPALLLIGLLKPGEDGNTLFSAMAMDPSNPLTMAGPCIGLGMLAAIAPCCLSCLGETVVNREGKSFYYMKMLPVPYSVQVRAKRDACARIFSIGSVGYVTALAVIGVITGIVSVPWALYTVILTASTLAVILNVQVLRGLKRPNLNWESESTIAKSSVFNMAVFLISFVLLLIIAVASAFLLVLLGTALNIDPCLAAWLAAGVILIATVTAGILLDRRVGAQAEKRLSML